MTRHENENQPVRYALPEAVGDEFVGRREDLAYLRHVIGRAPRRMASSIALIARRGMGKTALMQRFFNLIFFDRDFGVAPIYLSLGEHRPERRPDRVIPQLTVREFCELYARTYARHLLAYRMGNAELLQKEDISFDEVMTLAEKWGHAELATETANVLRQIESGNYHVVNILRWPTLRAYRLKEPHVYMIDEFQVVHGLYSDDRQHVVTIKAHFQTVAEARWAPMLVSGSIVSLVSEVVLTGLLSRRFFPYYLYELEPDEAHELVRNLSRMYDVPVSTDVTEAIVTRTGGHPFYIWAIIESHALTDRPEGITSLAMLDKIVQYEMSARRAYLGPYWVENFQNHLARVNADGLGEAILYWIASGEIEGEATPYKLVPLLRANPHSTSSGQGFDQVSERDVAEKLRELYEIDLLIRGTGLHGYEGLRDPVMTEFIHRNYYRDILRWSEREIEDSWRQRYYELLGKSNYFKGRVAESYVREAMRAFDGREVDGETYFGVAGPVSLPAFSTIRLRGRTMHDGRPVEIDVLGEMPAPGAGPAVWLVEVRYRTEPVGEGEATGFLERAAQVSEAYGYETPVLWVISRAGFTTPAETLLAERGVLCSDVEQFNALATLLETLLLPV